ncbi:MAG: TolC family protein [Verrucomicrobiae bacterium]|nr:TolC family protein [Verrucomicrobiae bacterium]
MRFLASLVLGVTMACFAPAGNATEAFPLPLSVKDCVRRALEENLEISIQRLNPLIDEEAVRTARGDFDPTLFFTPNYEENTTPLDAQSSVAAGGRLATKSRTDSWAGGVQGKVPLGTTYNFGLRTTDARNTFNTFREQYTTYWGLDLVQPLLRGFGPDSQMATLRIARMSKSISDADFAQRVMDVLTRVHDAYFNLVYAIENRTVQIQALELAAKLLEDNRKRVRIGVMAPLEITQAESGVAGREESVILADQDVSQRMTILRALISPNISDLQERALAPTDRPGDAPPSAKTRAQYLTDALDLRPDYRAAKLAVERQNIQLVYDQQQRWPQVDLKATAGFNGVDPKFMESIDTKNERWAVGLIVRVPLPDQAAAGRLEASRLRKQQTILQLKQAEQAVVVDVNNALDGVTASYKRIRATRVARRAAEEALSAETSKLRAGTTTSFVVLELQNKLAEARSREIRALADYSIAVAQLNQAVGTTLRMNDVELVPAAR